MPSQTEKKELPACPVETTLMLIGDKWKVLILRDLLPGTKRFGELKKSIGTVSQKVLTAQLRDMERNGLVNRKVYPEVPPRVEYSLTELGRSLKPILDAMWDWGEEFKLTQNKGRIHFRTRPSSNFNIFIPHCFKTCFQHLLQIKIALCYENRTRSITLPFPDIYLPAASGIAMHTRTINNVIPTTGQSGTVNGTII